VAIQDRVGVDGDKDICRVIQERGQVRQALAGRVDLDGVGLTAPSRMRVDGEAGPVDWQKVTSQVRVGAHHLLPGFLHQAVPSRERRQFCPLGTRSD
jgi:hypothetical protein